MQPIRSNKVIVPKLRVSGPRGSGGVPPEREFVLGKDDFLVVNELDRIGKLAALIYYAKDISFLIFAIARPGLRCFGQVLAQFMMVWHR
jgi:hypothetical protein